MRLLLTVLSFCWRCFDAAFSYTSARLQHWLYFISDAHLKTLDHHSLILTILPLYLFLFGRIFELHRGRTADQQPPALKSVSKVLVGWYLLYQAMNLLSSLAMVATTPGFLAKFIMALDLWFDFILTCAAKLSIGLLVQWLAVRSFYWPGNHERVQNLTDCARFCKNVMLELFMDMAAAVLEGSWEDALLGEDEVGERDRGEELDSEGFHEGDHGEEEYDVLGDRVALFGG